MADASLANVVSNDFSWVTPYGNIGVNYSGQRGRAANSLQANMNAAQRTAAANLRAAAPNIPGGIGVNVVPRSNVPGSNLTPVGDEVVGGGQITTAPVNPITRQPSAMDNTMDDARALWLSQGGSDRTMHRAQVAQGIRPAIDARAPHSASEAPSDASAAVIRTFGDGSPGQEGHSPWPVTSFGNAGSALWSQMTQKFNDARANLRAKLGVQNSTANVVGGPGDTNAPPDLMNPAMIGPADDTA